MDGLPFGETFLYNNIKFINHFFLFHQRAQITVDSFSQRQSLVSNSERIQATTLDFRPDRMRKRIRLPTSLHAPKEIKSLDTQQNEP
jgi:hypothetical protein